MLAQMFWPKVSADVVELMEFTVQIIRCNLSWGLLNPQKHKIMHLGAVSATSYLQTYFPPILPRGQQPKYHPVSLA